MHVIMSANCVGENLSGNRAKPVSYRHLTFHEFVSSLPAHWLACNPPLLSYYLRQVSQWLHPASIASIQMHLLQLYHALSDSTYFGKREFVLSYCVAEAVHHAG